MNEPTTQYGTPASVAPVMKDWKTNSETLASVMPKPAKEALRQETLGQLRRQLVRDEGPVRLHRGVVADVEQPQEQHCHPDRGDEREQEQADAAADRADEEERLAPAHRGLHVRSDSAPIIGWTSRPVIGPGQVEDRQVVRVRAEEGVDRVHGGLLHPEAVLDAEEAEVHEQDLPHVHQRLLPHDRGVRGRRPRHVGHEFTRFAPAPAR
jgi:hypothetical protein